MAFTTEFVVNEKYKIKFDYKHKLEDDNKKEVYRIDNDISSTQVAIFHFDKPYEAAMNYIKFMSK